jgi:predicted AAA+ superfamily ATPase
VIRRNITTQLVEALSDNPVVMLNGARQAGKSTLAKQIISEAHPARYLTLDDAAILAASKSDPAGFVAGLDGP